MLVNFSTGTGNSFYECEAVGWTINCDGNKYDLNGTGEQFAQTRCPSAPLQASKGRDKMRVVSRGKSLCGNMETGLKTKNLDEFYNVICSHNCNTEPCAEIRWPCFANICRKDLFRCLKS